MNSIWKTYNSENSQSLKDNLERDIVVVGGGIAGFLTAYQLSEKGQKVTLIEANTMFSGVTKNTTAHIEALQGIKYSDFSDRLTAKLYFESQLEAIKLYEDLINKYNIDCDFKRLDSYLYSLFDKKNVQKEYEILNNIGADVEYFEDITLLKQKVTAAIKLHDQASVEPIKLLSGIPIKFEVYENTRIIKIDYKEKFLYTEKYRIKAERIIIATNFPIIDIPGWYFLRMYKSNSYAISINSAENINGLYQDDVESGYTYRNYNDNLILGGLDHRTGRLDKTNIYQTLKEKAAEIDLAGEVTHYWSTNDCITFDGLPYIGYYSKCSRDVYIITGFNKWGLANAMIGSVVLSDMLTGKENKYEKLFSPQRKMPFSFDIIVNLLCVIKSLVIKPLLPPLKCYKKLKSGEGDIVMYHFKKRAVYKDENGEYHVCRALCAHLKCQLQFNPVDKTWDCPCHGSRYDIDGNLITAPTVKNLEKTR